jgi:hypothetical protein
MNRRKIIGSPGLAAALALPSALTRPAEARQAASSAIASERIFNVLSYGAIGNGTSNPASIRHASLGALQAAFPFATALTNELDWLGTQATINAALAAGGGTVYSPAGTYIYTNPSTAGDGSGTLRFPQCGVNIPNEFAVSWLGAFQASVHRWTHDLGTGVFAVLCSARSNGSSAGFLQDLQFVGPGVGRTLGTSTCNMQGIGTNDRRHMYRVNVRGFWAGINIVGGQTSLIEVSSQFCYYGYYFDRAQTENFGNIYFLRCGGASANKAAIGVHKNAAITFCEFESCFFGTSPFSIFKETGGTGYVLFECTFINTQFEDVGNALVSDDQHSAASRIAVIYNTKLQNCQFSWRYRYNIPSLLRYAVIDIAQVLGLQILDLVNSFSWKPGTGALFNFSTSVIGMIIDGDVNSLISNCGALPFFSGNGSYSVDGVLLRAWGAWSGTVCYTASPSVAGRIAVYTPGGIEPSVGTSGETVVGICMSPGTPWSIVANWGTVDVAAGASLTKATLVWSGPSGKAAPRGGRTIGFAVTDSSGSPATVTVKLQGLA